VGAVLSSAFFSLIQGSGKQTFAPPGKKDINFFGNFLGANVSKRVHNSRINKTPAFGGQASVACGNFLSDNCRTKTHGKKIKDSLTASSL
jgi:hypothetical protein